MKCFSDSFDINRDKFRLDFSDSSDFLMREITFCKRRAFVACFDGLVDSLLLSRAVLTPLMECDKSTENPLDSVRKEIVSVSEMNDVKTFDSAYFYMASGFAVLLIEGEKTALSFGVQGFTKRDTNEPTNEAMVKGAKECFVETLNDNKALIRKRIKSPELKLRQLKIDCASQTPIVIAYMNDRTDSGYLKLIEEKIKSVSSENIVDFGLIKEHLECGVKSPFSTVGNTERPDVFASKLLEGRVGIIIDSTPFALYTPYLFSDNFSSLDDYDNPVLYSSLIRLLKYFSFIISLFLPAIYVAVGTFHREMIPTSLLYIIATSEEATPFPLLTEGIIIHFLYEIMREAGLRLPKTVGHAVSIIGSLIIGESMVNAGIIGEPLLVVVALTTISSYAVYPLYESVAVLRIVFLLVAGVSGLYGLMLAAAVLFVNICALDSFGVPYSAPFSPLTKKSLGDTLVRVSQKNREEKHVNIFDLEGSNVRK